ncbi:MAG: hypothetical protein DRG59_04440 [Deltaproteobacteria bacterium]|nr:MAG: hypothetical protein DRG59_04440 [Deltaproteobacteria bacterium]
MKEITKTNMHVNMQRIFSKLLLSLCGFAAPIETLPETDISILVLPNLKLLRLVHKILTF